MPSMRFGVISMRFLAQHAQAHRRHAGQPQWEMFQIMAGRQAKFKAAPIDFDHVDKGLGEIWRSGVFIELGLDGHAFQGVHHIGDMHFLRAAHHTVVAGYTDPGCVAAQRFFAHPGPDHGKQHARGVIHICCRRAGTAAGATLDAHLQAGYAGVRALTSSKNRRFGLGSRGIV